MTTILTIAGSLRSASFNRRLLVAARRESTATDARWEHWDELAAVPPFSQDSEDGPVPLPVASLRAAIADAGAVLIATPEYNGSVPGVLKNAIDWASRPRETTVLRDKPVAVIGASPSPHGTAWAQADLRRSLGLAGADVLEAGLAVPQAFRQFDEHDHLLDADLRAELAAVLASLLDRATATTEPEAVR